MLDESTSFTTGYLDAFTSLRVDRSSGQPALHQPIVLLWAIARARQGKQRLISWHASKEELSALLAHHGRPGSTPAPEFPFTALHRSPLWTLEGVPGEVPQARGSSLRSWLDEHNPKGGLEKDLHELLARSGKFGEKAVCHLLQTYFADAQWQDILLDVGLQTEPFHGFGPAPYVPIGTVFANRDALAAANVHRPLQAGIWGKQKEDAKSIVVSGGYEDDEDLGTEIIYTGQGGMTEGRHTHHQELTRGNAALVNSAASGTPVRVIRGAGDHSPYAPAHGLRYDGLYRVEDYWSERRAVDDLRIWRFRLRAVDGETSLLGTDGETVNFPTLVPLPLPTTPEAVAEPDPGQRPDRRTAITQRLVRSTRRAQRVKELHDYTCQVCGIRISTPTGAYAEAAHIRPLGRPHDGPDRMDNILCLCPNHHVAFDFGMLTIGDDGSLYERGTLGGALPRLRTVAGHSIDPAYLAYHRKHHEE
ncbi:YDG/SRA domain-containing protein [Streptomyces sp. NPDC020422]|uniref:YDG/SRA domain-containing protein n=1 Tax=Streptomyces sp. NPDC020422 TaxID=3365074 RepID=UPI00379BB9FE